MDRAEHAHRGINVTGVRLKRHADHHAVLGPVVKRLDHTVDLFPAAGHGHPERAVALPVGGNHRNKRQFTAFSQAGGIRPVDRVHDVPAANAALVGRAALRYRYDGAFADFHIHRLTGHQKKAAGDDQRQDEIHHRAHHDGDKPLPGAGIVVQLRVL